MNFKAYIELIRPLNAFMGAIAVFIGAFITLGFRVFHLSFIYDVGLGCLAAIIYTAGGNALNDYFDREVDRINHPDRPIPSGRISPENALYYGIALLVLSILISAILTWICFFIMVTAVALILTYETYFKARGLSGNIIISAITSFSFLYGGGIANTLRIVVAFAILSFLASVGREIIKDIEDMEGDRGVRYTLPMKIGVKRAGLVAIAFITLAIAISPLPIFIGIYDGLRGMTYLILVSICDFIFIISIHQIIKNRYNMSPIPSHTTKIAMIFGLIAFLAPVFI